MTMSKNKGLAVSYLFPSIIILIGVLLYIPSLNVPLVYDDKDVILRPGSFDEAGDIKDLFTKDYFDKFGERTYRPVVTLSFFVDKQIWNNNIIYSHLFNAFLNIAVALVIFFLLGKLGISRIGSLLGSLIFLCHPVHTEAIVLISNREELLCALFFFLSLYFYLFDKKPLYVLSVFFFIMSLYSKEMAASLPLILLSFDIFKSKISLSRIKGYFPYIAHILFFLFLRYTFFRNVTGETVYPGGSMWITFTTMVSVYFRYLYLLFVPIKLCADHYVEIVYHLGFIDFIKIVTFFVYILFSVVMLKRKNILGFALSFFFLSFLPVSNIIPFGELMAERYVYIPSFAICLLFSLLFDSAGYRYIKGVLLVLIISLFCILSYQRMDVWKSEETLWKNTISCNPASSMAHMNLGNLYLRSGLIDRAIDNYNIVPSGDGNYSPHKYYYNLGLAYKMKGMTSESIRAMRESISINPDFDDARLNLADLYAETGEFEAGLREIKSALATKTVSPNTYYAAAVYCIKYIDDYRQNTEAIGWLNEAIKEVDDNPYYYAALGELYIRTENIQQAGKELMRALEIDPGNETALSIFERIKMDDGQISDDTNNHED